MTSAQRKNNIKKEISNIQSPYKVGSLIRYNKKHLGTIVSFYQEEIYNNIIPIIYWHSKDVNLPTMLFPMISDWLKNNVEVLT